MRCTENAVEHLDILHLYISIRRSLLFKTLATWLGFHFHHYTQRIFIARYQ